MKKQFVSLQSVKQFKYHPLLVVKSVKPLKCQKPPNLPYHRFKQKTTDKKKSSQNMSFPVVTHPRINIPFLSMRKLFFMFQKKKKKMKDKINKIKK